MPPKNPKKGTSKKTNNSEQPTSSASTSSTSSSTSTSSTNVAGDSTDPLFGYIQNVSQVKVSQKGSQYFSFELQQRVLKAVSFSPKKHKSVVVRQEETGSPCKISRFSPHATEENVIWVNQNTQKTDALETTVEYSQHDQPREAPKLCTTKELNDIQVHESVSVRGYVVFGEQKAVPIPTKKDLTKREGCLVDDEGIFRVTLWNDSIQSMAEGGFFEIQSMRLRQYQGEKYLSSASDTVFKKISQNAPASVPQELISTAMDQLKDKEIPCLKINSVTIQTFFSCVNCARKVLFQQDSEMLRCNNCHARFLIENGKKTTVANNDVKNAEGETTWYALFTPVLEAILKKHNDLNGQNEQLEKIDDDALSSIILRCKGLILKVNSNSSVVGIAFDSN